MLRVNLCFLTISTWKGQSLPPSLGSSFSIFVIGVILIENREKRRINGMFKKPLRACYALCIVVVTLEVWTENLTPVMLAMTNGPLWLPT
jgi:hypothetical protein